MPEHPQDLLIRPIEPSDRERLAAAFLRLSPVSRYRRFLSPKPSLSRAELTYLTDVDHSSHEALAAVDPATGELIGEARYASVPGTTTAELTVFVIDDWHRRGLGSTLARRIVERACANGIARLEATTLFENHAARALLRRLGFRARGSAHGAIELALDLQSTLACAA